MGIEAMSIEEMRAELEVAGYKDIANSDHLEAWAMAHPVYGFDIVFPNIYVAHEHLQKERQFEALKEFVEKLASYDVQNSFTQYMGDDMAIWRADSTSLAGFVEEAKKLLRNEL